MPAGTSWVSQGTESASAVFCLVVSFGRFPAMSGRPPSSVIVIILWDALLQVQLCADGVGSGSDKRMLCGVPASPCEAITIR